MTAEELEERTGPLTTGRRPGWVGRLALDVRPLRESPEFRRLWTGQTVSLIGTAITQVAVPVQVYALTGSSLAVGLLGLVALVPLIGSGLVGSTLVDVFDRRRIALVTSTGFLLSSAALLTQQQLHLRQVWLLYAVVFVQSLLLGVDSPARRSFIPRLLPAEQVASANTLSQISFNVGQTGGPLLAGLILATAGVGTAYLVDCLSFAGSLWALLALRPMRPTPGATRPGIGSTVEGFRFLRTQPIVLTTFVADIIAMLFGMPRALFPALAQQRFHAGPGAVGLLYAALSAGALLGALGGGWLSRVRRQGTAVLLAIAVWGTAVVAFGLTATLWVALLLLAVAGGADMVSAVFRSTILQLATPDELQGRMQGVFIVVVSGGPRLGDVEAGAVATVGLEFSVVSGGLACLAGIALVAAAVPRFRRYELPA